VAAMTTPIVRTTPSNTSGTVAVFPILGL